MNFACDYPTRAALDLWRWSLRRDVTRLCTVLALGTLAVDVQSCARGRYLERSVIAAAPHAALVVTNYTTEALRVNLVARGVEFPLGPVPALGSRMFQVPMPAGARMHEYQLRARDRGSVMRFESAAFSIALGQVARWMLSPMQGAMVYVQ